MHALEQLKVAQEEVQAKTSQVKQYKKQHDQATAQVFTCTLYVYVPASYMGGNFVCQYL